MCPPMSTHWRHLANAIELVNVCFLGPTRVHNQNGKSTGSAVFAQLTAECHWALFAGFTSVTDRPTDHATWSVTIGRNNIRNTVMWPNNNTEMDLKTQTFEYT